MIDHSPGIGIRKSSFNFLELPFLGFKIGLHGFIQQVGPVTIQRTCESVESGNFFGFQSEADSLFVHNT